MAIYNGAKQLVDEANEVVERVDPGRYISGGTIAERPKENS